MVLPDFGVLAFNLLRLGSHFFNVVVSVLLGNNCF